ncbi:MAG: protein jag [Micropruina sp.]|nr:protein jag [Micropruina sp.]
MDETITDVISADETSTDETNTEVVEAETAEVTDDDGDDDGDGDETTGEGGEKKSKRETALDNEGDIAADYLEELLDIADLDGDIDTFNEGGRAHVSIITDAAVLVGKDGEVLEALQELARLAVMTETGHRSRLMLDIAGHRERRRTELQALAQEAIAEAKASGEAVRLVPMNPFERKIVHDVVAEAGLISESEGEEPKRRVVVMPKA